MATKSGRDDTQLDDPQHIAEPSPRLVCVAVSGASTCGHSAVHSPAVTHKARHACSHLTMAGGNELEGEVLTLLQTRRYDPEILPTLEAYVDHQVAAGASHVDPDSNLAVLKLYQFYPERYRVETVSKILIKALMTLPSTDFLCALYLVPERRQVDEPIPVISRLAELLETGCFGEFWEASGACQKLLESVPGSLEAVRKFMTGVIERTYRVIDLGVLGKLLDLEGAALKEALEASGWTEDGGVVTIPINDENQPTPPSVDEQLTFQKVAATMLIR